jgi:hypothetical protein
MYREKDIMAVNVLKMERYVLYLIADRSLVQKVIL